MSIFDAEIGRVVPGHEIFQRLQYYEKVVFAAQDLQYDTHRTLLFLDIGLAGDANSNERLDNSNRAMEKLLREEEGRLT